jgi:hypothetical protein
VRDLPEPYLGYLVATLPTFIPGQAVAIRAYHLPNTSSGSIAKLALNFTNSLVLVADGYLHDSITYVCSAPVVGDYVLLALRTSKDDSAVT